MASRAIPNSRKLFQRAKRVIPGGVNSPVRAFKAVGGVPLFLERGKGARVWDADGHAYIDYVGSWGPLILGHAHPAVQRAARKAMAAGTSFGAPTAREIELAEMVCRALPGVSRVRMVSSGTEATMSAVRLARAATGRARILKFEGGYHGHVDSLLVGAGSGAATLGVPDSPGVPKEFTKLTLQAPYNDLAAVEAVFARWGRDVAAILVEPVAGNMGCVPPRSGFLQGLREICDRAGALLIFDEVMTGFRVAWGGAQVHFGVRPDLTCLGKVIGGGFPAAAYAGPTKLMDQISPAGPVYQAGTLSGNPVAVAAALETLRRLQEPGAYARLTATAERLAEGLQSRADQAGVEFSTTAVGGMLGFFFHPGPVHNFAEASKASAARFRRFHGLMLSEGVYLPPSPFEILFVSLAHGRREIDETLEAAAGALHKVARAR